MDYEKKQGISGYRDAQTTLEKVSEKKSELDEFKNKTLTEISEIVNTLMQSIQSKKNQLAPVIQELRTVRQQVSDIESDYLEKKKAYDAVMAGLEGEVVATEQEVRNMKQDIISMQTRTEHLNSMMQLKLAQEERVAEEIKSYTSSENRGKTHRDLYNKQISELEQIGRGLNEEIKKVKSRQEYDIKQVGMFADLKKLLEIKYEHNKNVLLRGKVDAFEGSQVYQDRLVL